MIRLKISHILVPTDFSTTASHAFQHALKIAAAFNARMSLMHVKEVYSHEVLLPEVMTQDLQVSSGYDEKVREGLEAWRDQANSDGVSNVELIYSNGRIAQEIANYARDESVSLIVMGTHGTKGVEEFFLGSNAYRVISAVKCPVLTVRTETPVVDYKTVLVPMDETPSSRQKLAFCADFAKAFKARLKLLCLCETADQQQMTHLDAVCAQVSDFLQNENISFSLNRVEADNTAQEVVHHAEFADADLIIIMSETETTIGGLLLGSYAQQVVNHSSIPVLTIHPEERDVPLDIFS